MADQTRPRDTSVVDVKVVETFSGLPKDVKEGKLVITGAWLRVGESYLMDVRRAPAGAFALKVCGVAWEATGLGAPYVRYLRGQKNGVAATSLIVRTMSNGERLAFTEVTIAGSAGEFRAASDVNGEATFTKLPPGKYRISARKGRSADAVPAERYFGNPAEIEVKGVECTVGVVDLGGRPSR